MAKETKLANKVDKRETKQKVKKPNIFCALWPLLQRHLVRAQAGCLAQPQGVVLQLHAGGHRRCCGGVGGRVRPGFALWRRHAPARQLTGSPLWQKSETSRPGGTWCTPVPAMKTRVKTDLEKTVENRHMQDRIMEIKIPTEEVVEIKDGKKKVVSRKIYRATSWSK